MNQDQIVDVVTRWQKAFEARDMKTFAEIYAEHAVMESPLAGAVTGREAVTKTTMALLSAFPDTKFTYETPMIDGMRAAIPAMSVGTHVGTFLGIAPSGRNFHVSLVFLLEFKDGRIVRDRRVYDFTGFLVQLGVLKAKPA